MPTDHLQWVWSWRVAVVYTNVLRWLRERVFSHPCARMQVATLTWLAYMTLHVYMLQICKLLATCVRAQRCEKTLSLNHRNTFVYTNMATATRTYPESQRKYTELQVVYTSDPTPLHSSVNTDKRITVSSDPFLPAKGAATPDYALPSPARNRKWQVLVMLKAKLKRHIPRKFCDYWWLFRMLHVSCYGAWLFAERRRWTTLLFDCFRFTTS